MKFKQYINEIKATDYETEYRRGSDNIEIWLYLDGRKDLSNAFVVNIYPYPTTKVALEDRFNLTLASPSDIKYWDINFKDIMGMETMQPKDKGIALKLFGALENEITKFIKSQRPRVIRFRVSDNSASRLKLYKFLANKIEKSGKYKSYQFRKQFWMIKKSMIVKDK